MKKEGLAAMVRCNVHYYYCIFLANFPIVNPCTNMEKQTMTYVIVTQISLLYSGLIDSAKAMEIPPRNPPQVKIKIVF